VRTRERRIHVVSDIRLDDVEREAIFSALAQTGGHFERAAGLLGISRRTLSRKLRTYREEGVADVASIQ
jgi:DNA-binding NtrC family response regulator